jgi:hypothetical protein
MVKRLEHGFGSKGKAWKMLSRRLVRLHIQVKHAMYAMSIQKVSYWAVVISIDVTKRYAIQRLFLSNGRLIHSMADKDFRSAYHVPIEWVTGNVDGEHTCTSAQSNGLQQVRLSRLRRRGEVEVLISIPVHRARASTACTFQSRFAATTKTIFH